MTRQTRRTFVAAMGSCAAHIMAANLAGPALLRRSWSRRPFGPVVADEKFGRLEEVGPGVWALISTPLSGDFTTTCNGGIIAGKNGVLAVEGFMQPAGASWLVGKAKELTGKRPTHVVVTHYHSDHSNGVAGYFDGGSAAVHATATTGGMVRERNKPEDPKRNQIFSDAIAVDPAKESSIDLGGRKIRMIPRGGHTASDVTIELDDPSIVFTGDLVWNAMFPNYVDAVPTQLAKSVKALRRSKETVYVPGHGSISKAADLDGYEAMLAEVERAAREAHGKGLTAQAAASGYSLPASLGQWVLFSPAFIQRAFEAWFKELS